MEAEDLAALNDAIVRAWGRSAFIPAIPVPLSIAFDCSPPSCPALHHTRCLYSSLFPPPSTVGVCIFRPLIILNMPTLGCTSWNPNCG
jgi:hypothetical protein